MGAPKNLQIDSVKQFGAPYDGAARWVLDTKLMNQ